MPDSEADTTPPMTVIEPSRGWPTLGLGEAWKARELVAFFAWRDVRVRYRQTFLGVSWVVLQPLLAVVLFAVLFGRVLKLPSGGAPYAVFACAGLVPWQFFAAVTTRCAQSLVSNASLLTKVYFPRVAVPLGAALAALLDFAVGLVVLLAISIWHGITPEPSLLWLLLAIPQAALAAVGVGLWVGAANVRFRDVGQALPFVIQLSMFVTPVLYSIGDLPDRVQLVMAINPITAGCELTRMAILGRTTAGPEVLWLSAATGWALFVSGMLFFRHAERSFADTI